MTEVRIAVTYGGIVGRLARRLGLRWNHIIIVLVFPLGVPWQTYESNWRGVHCHPFRESPDLAEEHEWYEPVIPLNTLDVVYFSGYCEGSVGKWYAFHYLLLLGWRALKRLCTKPHRALLVPAETCATFVNEPCAAIGRPVSVMGASGLPDDIMDSPHWRKVEMPGEI